MRLYLLIASIVVLINGCGTVQRNVSIPTDNYKVEKKYINTSKVTIVDLSNNSTETNTDLGLGFQKLAYLKTTESLLWNMKNTIIPNANISEGELTIWILDSSFYFKHEIQDRMPLFNIFMYGKGKRPYKCETLVNIGINDKNVKQQFSFITEPIEVKGNSFRHVNDCQSNLVQQIYETSKTLL